MIVDIKRNNKRETERGRERHRETKRDKERPRETENIFGGPVIH